MIDGVDITQLLIERGHLLKIDIKLGPKIKTCHLRCIFRISKVFATNGFRDHQIYYIFVF